MPVRMVDAMGGVSLSPPPDKSGGYRMVDVIAADHCRPPDTFGGYRMVDAMGGVSLLQPPDTSGGHRMIDGI
jgi:hypothetical protein